MTAALYEEALATFRQLLAAATDAGEPEPTAMTLATSDDAGRISARVVLLKEADSRGFVFYTNYQSRKAAELDRQRRAALCFLWKTLRHGVQVRVEGLAERVSAAESDAYFATRPRESQIGAWASMQSQTLPDRATLVARVEAFTQRFAGQPVPRPPHWGGYRVVPDRIEFWYGRPHRLHERECYSLDARGWSKCLLYP
jgi:pyridoxamine 5'-phosphate oxidase